MNDNFPFATCFLLFPTIIASLSVVAYQQAQATTTSTTKSCNVGRYSSGSTCRQVCNTALSTNDSAKWKTQKSNTSVKTADF